MTDDPATEVARLLTVVGEEPTLIRNLADTATRLQEILDAKARLKEMSDGHLPVGILTSCGVRRP